MGSRRSLRQESRFRGFSKQRRSTPLPYDRLRALAGILDAERGRTLLRIRNAAVQSGGHLLLTRQSPAQAAEDGLGGLAQRPAPSRHVRSAGHDRAGRERQQGPRGFDDLGRNRRSRAVNLRSTRSKGNMSVRSYHRHCRDVRHREHHERRRCRDRSVLSQALP